MKTLHTDKEGRLFFRKDGWPEKPLGPVLTMERNRDHRNRMIDYEQALTKAFESAVPVEITSLEMYAKILPLYSSGMQGLTAYSVPEGYRVDVCAEHGCIWEHRMIAYLVPVAPSSEGEKKQDSDPQAFYNDGWYDAVLQCKKLLYQNGRQSEGNMLNQLLASSTPTPSGGEEEDCERMFDGKQAIDFATWYSDMDREKVQRAFRRWINERLCKKVTF